MGKKDKNKKKGLGAEKTNLKTEKKASLKQKKMLAKIGEADILEMVEKLEKDSKSAAESQEIKCDPPSPRSTFSLVSHPDKDELILFGGEYYDGQKTTLYNDLYFYNVSKNEWRMVKCGGSVPTPRSGAQIVVSSSDGGQLWMFGGEYASPSMMQFIHFKDLWVFRIAQKKWEKITAPDGPSARSGHRMVLQKKKLFVFGGFHDNNNAYRYFNDVHCFSLETYTWIKLKISGANPPAPRSGCCFAPCPDGKLLMWGGYSKSTVKKEAERGTTHWDSYHLCPDKNDESGATWKWVSVKLGGARPPPRSGMSSVVAPNGKIYVFGGVMDEEEDEESIKGKFSNELYTVDATSLTWRKIEVKPKSAAGKAGKDVAMKEEEETKKPVQTDGVFTLTVRGGSASAKAGEKKDGKAVPLNGPSGRSHVGIAFSKGLLYVYAGIFEEDDRQFTLTDFYSLDVTKLQEWKTILGCDLNKLEWLGSDSESDDDEDDDTEGGMDDDDSDDSEDDDDSDDSAMDTE